MLAFVNEAACVYQLFWISIEITLKLALIECSFGLHFLSLLFCKTHVYLGERSINDFLHLESYFCLISKKYNTCGQLICLITNYYTQQSAVNGFSLRKKK